MVEFSPLEKMKIWEAVLHFFAVLQAEINAKHGTKPTVTPLV